MDDLLSDFLIETQGRFAAFDAELTEFVRRPSDAQIQGHILELMHTIKGASILLDLPRLADIAQASENVIDRARTGAVVITPMVASLIVDSISAVRRIQRSIATSGAEPKGDDADLVNDLRAAAEGKPLKRAAIPEPQPAPQEPGPDSHAEPLPPTRPRAQAGALAPLQPSVFVPIERIEHLTTLVGDLVQARNSLNDLLRRRDDADLEEWLEQLSHITSDLGTGFMATRKQALSEVAEKGFQAFDILHVISVECAGSHYAIPQRNVLELVRVTPSERAIGRDEVRLLRLREQRHPWVQLTTLLKIGSRERPKDWREAVVMIDAGDGPFGLAVDRVLDIEGIVSRPLPPLLSAIAFFSGSTILGDGSIAMVLSPHALGAELGRTRYPAIAGGAETRGLPQRD